MGKDKTWEELMDELSPEDAKEFFDRWNHHFMTGTINHPDLPMSHEEESDLNRCLRFLARRGVMTTH